MTRAQSSKLVRVSGCDGVLPTAVACTSSVPAATGVLQTRFGPSVISSRLVASSPPIGVSRMPLGPGVMQMPSSFASAVVFEKIGPHCDTPSVMPLAFQSIRPKPRPPPMPTHSSRLVSVSGGSSTPGTSRE